MSHDFEWVGATQNEYQFVTDLAAKRVTLTLALRAPVGTMPALHAVGTREIPSVNYREAVSVPLTVAPGGDALTVSLTLPKLGSHARNRRGWDDRIVVRVTGADVPDLRVEVRRTRCVVRPALLGIEAIQPEVVSPTATEKERESVAAREAVKAQRTAALLWYGWNRCEEIVALKRITSGKSGSDVTVFRPKLAVPATEDAMLIGRGETAAGAQSWGTPLLVKTSLSASQADEWQRYGLFVADRLQPFMARCSDLIVAQPLPPMPIVPAKPTKPPKPTGPAKPGDAPEAVAPRMATMLGAFLGGDLMQIEPLRAVIRAGEADQAERIIRQTAEILSEWHTSNIVQPLACWSKTFETDPTKSESVRLFPYTEGGVPLALDLQIPGNPVKKGTRAFFTEALKWDIPFCKSDHLDEHVVGTLAKPGLLRRIAGIDVRYSVIHGDLHDDNVLADKNNAWLLDWGRVAVGPTLFDYAKLEVFFRIHCLDLTEPAASIGDPARAFESLLLDCFFATDSSLEPLTALAAGMGAKPEQLTAVARSVIAVRRAALRCGGGRPDRLDYLAVLYLATLLAMTYANRDRHGSAQESADQQLRYQALMGLFWLLEEKLSLMLGMAPYERRIRPCESKDLVQAEWMTASDASQRIVYLMGRPDGRRALPMVAAMRGILQGRWHHLDVFDHTMLAVAYLEDLLQDPIGSLSDPLALDEAVRIRLAGQGIRLPEFMETLSASAPEVDRDVIAQAESIRDSLSEALTVSGRNVVKWASLLHDVGKPRTRTLNVDPKSPLVEKVQFIGHESFGANLVEPLLAQIFAGAKADRMMAKLLIERHHLHHDYCNADHYLNPKRWAALLETLRTGKIVATEQKTLAPIYKDEETMIRDAARAKGPSLAAASEDSVRGPIPHFPWLILLGCADALACRGVGVTAARQRVCEIGLALLALHFRAPQYRYRDAMQIVCDGQLKAVRARLFDSDPNFKGQIVGKVSARLEERFMARMCPPGATVPPADAPTGDELREWATDIWADLRP